MSDSPSPHPIVDFTMSLLEETGSGSYRFRPGGLEELTRTLSTATDIEEIWEMGRHLMAFAYYLDTEESSPETAGGILKALEVLAPQVEAYTKKAAANATSELVERAQGFAAFAGKTRVEDEPKLGKTEDQVPARSFLRGPVKG